MGKYDALAKTLPRAPKAPHSDQVTQAMDLITNRSPVALAQAYLAARTAKATAEAALKATNVQVKAAELLLIDAYGEADVSSMKLADGSTVSTNPDPYVVTLDRDAVRSWAQANGHERDLNINAQTLSAITKTRALAGDGLPDGVELRVWTAVRMTKA